jgi:thermitase
MKTRVGRLTLYAGLSCLILIATAAGILSPADTASATMISDGSVTAFTGAGLHSSAVFYGKIDSQAPSRSNDTCVGKQWALDRVHIPAAWTVKQQNEVVVAVLDTGIDTKHEDLAGVVIQSINLTKSATAEDVLGHGTHVAGVITARTNNGTGIAGTTQHVKLLNVKIANDNGDCSSVDMANGIVWAADHGANVINLSLVINLPSAGLESAVDYAWAKGAVVIAATGNGINPVKSYPALYRNCIAVVGANANDQVGTGLAGKEAIAAPGYNIFSTLPGNKYGYKSGSSMAAAYVSAAAALAFSTAQPGTINLNGIIREQLWKSTDPIASGMLNYRYINFEKLATTLQP